MKLKIPVPFYLLVITILVFITIYNIYDIIPIRHEVTGPPPEVILQSFHSSSEISKCKPKTNIVFLKTHKTAGTSVQNILLRYSYKRELTVALPILSHSHIFESSKNFSRDMLQIAPWRLLGYNLFCHHMVYNETAFKTVMPSDSVYVTILRDPINLFESYYEYMNLREQLGMSLEEFAKLTTKKGAVEKLCKRKRIRLPRNVMLKDFGIQGFENSKVIQDMINHVDKKFHLVMITERFDESVVLLKHLLCWDTADVVSFRVNARSQSYKRNLSSTAVQLLKDWNKGDMDFYERFSKKLEVEIARFGKLKMHLEVTELSEERTALFNSCIDQVVPSVKLIQFKYWTPKVLGFKLKVNSDTCVNLVKPERELTNAIRLKQLWLSLPDTVAEKLKKVSNVSSFSLNESILKSVNNVLRKGNKKKKKKV